MPKIRRCLPSLASLLAAALASGCGGDGGANPTDPSPSPSPDVHSVAVAPSGASLDALDATASFTATARDDAGRTMTGISFTWSSTDPEVATVSGSGVATARANGIARIVARAGGAADTAVLTVDQVVTSVSVSPSSVTMAVGETASLAAEPQDAGGHPVADASVAWSSGDPGVVEVDAGGRVTAKAEGTATISATSEGRSGTSEITVTDGSGTGAPLVEGISPDPMPEGGQVTLRGRNFASSASGNTVTVDGVVARVAAATATELTVEVPLFDCLPARVVEVRVETEEGAASAAAGLEPDELPVALAAGSESVLSDPPSACLQFPESDGDERYLLLVQSLSSVVDGFTSVRITAEAADGASAASAAPLALAAAPDDRGGPRRPREARMPDVPSWLREQRAAEPLLREWERRHVGTRNVLRESGPPVAAEVTGSVAVGDEVRVRVPGTGSGDLCTTFTEITGLVRAVGDRAILVSDVANPSGGFTDADYGDFSDWIDQHIVPTQVDYFGSPSDIDGNGRIVAVVSKEVNEHWGFVGFVWTGDLLARSDCHASDEGEFFYARAPDPTGQHGDVYGTDVARGAMPFVMAHELTHVIQQSRRLTIGKPKLDSWLSEAQATLSEEVVGHAVTGRSPGLNYGFDVAANTAGTDEIDWYVNAFVDVLHYFGFETSSTRVAGAPEQCGWLRSDPSPCAGRALWYGVGWSFLRWLSDHWGPTHVGGERELNRRIVDGESSGWGAVEAVSGEAAADLLARWAAALYVDDRIPGASARLTLPSWNLQDMEESVVRTAHLQPYELPFGDWQATGTVRSSSAAYLALEGPGREATAIRVRDGADGPLPPHVQVVLVRLR